MLSLGERTHPACPGGPLSPPYVTVKDGGRLGNLILEYAATWAVARQFKLPAFVPDSLHRRLKEVFVDLSLPPAWEVLARDPDCAQPARALQLLSSDTAVEPSAGAGAGGSAEAAEAVGAEAPADPEPTEEQPWKSLTSVDLASVSLSDAVKEARTKRALIVLDLCAELPEAVVPHAAYLREELRFRPLLQRAAQAELRKLRRKHFPKFQGEVVFAAVHVRRTDYHNQLMLLYNVSRPANIDYYVSAAAWLRRSLPVEKALLFVVTSDDRDWVEEFLIPAMTAAGAVEKGAGGAGWAAAWAGSGDTYRPERDLAVLSACNHTVFSYGTFGIAAALLAGGRAAAFQLAPTPHHPTLLSVAEQFARNIPGWVTLR